jgi:uncharacterized cofD-like protein
MKNIVTVGGGTGSYTVLSGLKNISDVSLTALVSMADDGGSTGVLVGELGVLPPGDVRQCLVALSEHTKVILELMNYRFTDGKLSGHNFGNIFLAALEKVTGDFAEGVEVASDILKVKGRVIPITKNKAKLIVSFNDGTQIEGESNLDEASFADKKIEKIFYKDSVKISFHAAHALLTADYIILGPGDFYTSLLPNIIVTGFKETIADSKAKIILPINLTNKEGHTNNWKVSDYVNNLEKYLNKKVDYILVNNETPSLEQIEPYKTEIKGEVLVHDDFEDPRVIREGLLSHTVFEAKEADIVKRSLIRHDSHKLAKCIHKIINK